MLSQELTFALALMGSLVVAWIIGEATEPTSRK